MAAKKQWQREWSENIKTAATLRRITKGKDAKTGLTLYNEIENRNGAAEIAQLRTGHCGLNRNLYHFGIKHSPYSQREYGKEIVEHYLLECRKYREQRKKLRREAGKGKMQVEIALGDPKTMAVN